MHTSFVLGLLPSVLVALQACQPPTPGPTASAVPAPSASEKHGMRPPMLLEVRGPEKVVAPSAIVLVARIRRTFASPVPLHLELRLPSKVELISGDPDETIEDDEHLVIERSYLLWVPAIPTEDVRVLARWEADSWGANAIQPYRFGRPAPRLAPPLREGTEAIVVGRRLGRSIPIAPREVTRPALPGGKGPL